MSAPGKAAENEPRFVRANGLRLGYRELGSGPPLVLLHGATSSGSEDFAAQLPALSTAFRCLLPDARGHGATRWDATDGFELGWLVDDLAGFVDALGIPTFHLFGFSMGAMTALHFAVRDPGRLRTLVAAGITTAREPRASVARRLMDPERIDRQDPAWAARLAARHDPHQGPGAWRRLLPAIAADVGRQPLLAPRDLRRIDAPALVMAGDRDPFVPVDHAAGLRRQLPDARLLIVPDSGHEVTARQPAIVNEALGVFYRSTADTAARRAELEAERRIAEAVRAAARTQEEVTR
ncbi:MAG TPA: alpha/beta hydrolase [Candidatus Limnocylindrales bacterium]|nr:alpha/beta hydrolase [Candidatus Limnocylindrales bacterium]